MDKTYTLKNGKQVSIRPLEDTEKDIQAALAFINAIRKEDVKVSNVGPPLTYEQEALWVKDLVKQITARKKLYYAVFCKDVMVAGVVIEKKADRSTHVGVFGITLAKEVRGQGLGSYLMKNILQEASKALSITHVQLACFANNTPAYNLYKKMGFEDVGRVPEMILYKGDLIDEIIMMKKL